MKRNSLFYKIFLPMFLLGTVLVAGFSIYIYTNTYDSFEKSYLSDKTSLLRQTKTNIEWRIRTIEYSFSTYGTTSNFTEVFTQPMTHEDYLTYSEVRKELNFIEAIVMDDNTYSLVSLAGKWGVINGTLNQLTDEEVKKFQEEYIHSNNNLFWKKAKDGIEMIITLPMFEKEKYALGIAEINRNTINQIVDKRGNDIITIENQDGKLYSSSPDADDVVLFKNKKEQVEYNKPKIVRQDGHTYILMRSDYNNWIYSLRVDQQAISRTVRGLRAGLMIVSLALIALIGILSMKFSDRFARPISQIQEHLNVKSHGFKDRELDRVVQSINHIIGENRLLSANLISQKPQLETLFVLSLFRNRVGKRELSQRLEQFGYKNQEKYYYTALVQIDLLKESHGGERDLLLLAINNIVTELVPEEMRMLPIVLNEEMQATIFRVDKTEADASKIVMEYCQKIQETIQDYLSLSVSIGISNRFETLSESKLSVDRAKEALYYRVNTGPSSIIFYKEIAPAESEKTRIKYPTDQQNRLFEAIRSGDKELAPIVHELIVEIFKKNKNPLSVEVISMRLINEIVQLGQLLGVDTIIFKEIKQIYFKALNNYDPQELEDIILKQLVLPISQSSQALTEQEFKSLSEAMVHIVYTEYDQDLSLDLIADRLHYNPNYLSSVFKKETGENFGDFVQNYRLEVAKKWLKETDLSVKEIAEKLRYRNSQNFIRFFKKKVESTPGEYRKKNR
jgi:two-component system response regulator YesN